MIKKMPLATLLFPLIYLSTLKVDKVKANGTTKDDDGAAAVGSFVLFF